jgi:hypothetical protein
MNGRRDNGLERLSGTSSIPEVKKVDTKKAFSFV